jgi:CDP-glucose 4,6-dehydratase
MLLGDNLMRKNVLITGIQGFVGSNLALHELSKGNHVVGIVRDNNHKTREDILSKCSIIRGDITDLSIVDHAVGYYEIDTVYHLAANSIVKVGMADPVSNYNINVGGTVNVLDSVRRIRPGANIVVSSSDKAYGNHDVLPYTEDMKLNPGCPYSTSKSCTDLISQSFAMSYNLNINTVRCSNIYGPGDMNTSRLIPNSILRCLRGEKPVVYSGVADYRREFIYIKDVCEAYSLVADKGTAGEIYNIGINSFITIKDVLTKIVELMGVSGIDVIEKDFPEIPFQWMDGTKLNSLGWHHTTSFDDGLKRSIGWYTNKHQEQIAVQKWAAGELA